MALSSWVEAQGSEHHGNILVIKRESMHEQIEEFSWYDCDEILDPAISRLRAEAHRNGRSINKQFAYETMLELGWIKQSNTHSRPIAVLIIHNPGAEPLTNNKESHAFLITR